MKNNFFFAGKDLALLSKKLGTPFFLFDEANLEENFEVLKRSFSSSYRNLRIDYSLKTNHELGILKILKRYGLSLEISSVHELEIAKKAGFHPQEMVWDNPVKKEDEIDCMIDNNIHAFYLDNQDDIRRVQKVAGQKDAKVKIVLRVNPGFPWAFLDPAEKFLGKFGTPRERISQVADFIERDCPNLKLIGLSVHVGSQKLTPKSHLRALKIIFSLVRDLERKGFKMEELCMGGGYPSESLNKKTLLGIILSFLGITLNQKITPVGDFGQQISRAFAEEVKKISSRPQLVIQPGRSLVSRSAVAVGKVMVVKDKWIFLDLSTSSLPESLFFGQRKVFLVNKYREKPYAKYHVAGRGLNTADNLAIFRPLPKPEVGDLAVILDSGAYTISRANRFTVLNPPVYLATKAGKIKRIRRTETYEDILSPMEF